MKILIIGLGSMGKRRIRNLKALNISDICGFDQRADRRKEAEDLYGIKTYSTFEDALATKVDALVISVPPDIHHVYMKHAIKEQLPFFVEASVVDDDMDSIIKDVEQAGILAAPSSTMTFHPAIKKIMSFVTEGVLGKITNVIYHSGQYLPDWHTYETVKEFYVSNKSTGGAREIVPFELTWLVKLLGFPAAVTGLFKKTIEITGAEEIDDTYNALFDYGSFILNLSIDVVSRLATRKLLINGSEGQLQWDWNDDYITVYTPDQGSLKHHFSLIDAQAGYNKNITEQMYIEEMDAFIQSINQNRPFVNDLRQDHKVLKLLYALEESGNNAKTVKIEW
ncbi:Gfo/Idh/MocA family protein [Mucilaginibacter ginkgonis]|uniref:Gfo/Idh/MocA family oxidoreductase n=1 Tax=Mucilaginibacter ginkgonis TaxID=2682091 RepID=A0A6I4I4N6_9SPHI|nr:Gfo/Idh/MocA family oxidoreductase [Mucilaginibacter ginkgonis]QQL50838.1 Gfo/Idh/MocA family oxidoreductase [Mucilaginibacter ginkgonis]